MFDALSLIPELAPTLPIAWRRSCSWRRSTPCGAEPDEPDELDELDDRLVPTAGRARRFTVLLRRSVSGRSLSGVLLIDESRMIFISRTVRDPAQLTVAPIWWISPTWDPPGTDRPCSRMLLYNLQLVGPIAYSCLEPGSPTCRTGYSTSARTLPEVRSSPLCRIRQKKLGLLEKEIRS